MNHAPHLYFAWQQLVEKSQLMLRLATEEQWDELIASEMAYVNAVQEIAHLTEEVDPSTTMQEQLRPMLRLILDNESKVSSYYRFGWMNWRNWSVSHRCKNRC